MKKKNPTDPFIEAFKNLGISLLMLAVQDAAKKTKAKRDKTKKKRVVKVVECSGGHPEWHIKGDVLRIIKNVALYRLDLQSGGCAFVDRWDLIIAHPPCTHLASSGAKHFAKKIADGRQHQGIDFFMSLANAECDRLCIENPVGIMSSKYRKPDQIIQPWQFGDQAQKTTCLWLKNLPPLIHTNIVDKGEFYTSPSGKRMPKWYSDNKSSKNRSKTFEGIAKAMADQWGKC